MNFVRTLFEKLDTWDKSENVLQPGKGYCDNYSQSCRLKGCRNVHEMRSSDAPTETGVFDFLHGKARQMKAILGYDTEQTKNDDTKQSSPSVNRRSNVRGVKEQRNVMREVSDRDGFVTGRDSPLAAGFRASSPEDEDLDSSIESLNTDATSWTDRVRKMSQNIRREIILKHRRHEKQKKLQVKAEICRNKYRTNDKVSSTKNDIAKDITTKNKGFLRLFKTVKTRLTTRNVNESRSVRDRVALKLAKRRNVYDGCSRDQITADIRQKYFKAL